MEPLVRLFRVLANRRRIQILCLLAVIGEMRVRDLADALDMAQPRL
ncbi:MAG: ArsR family transcriptional regulator, partial [Planctomycetota bacterium]